MRVSEEAPGGLKLTSSVQEKLFGNTAFGYKLFVGIIFYLYQNVGPINQQRIDRTFVSDTILFEYTVYNEIVMFQLNDIQTQLYLTINPSKLSNDNVSLAIF